MLNRLREQLVTVGWIEWFRHGLDLTTLIVNHKTPCFRKGINTYCSIICAYVIDKVM